MDYPVSAMRGEPRFDTLGVLKLRCAPTVPVDDRLFAQAQVGRTPALFFTRIWSCETAPAEAATLRALFSYQGHTLELSANAAGEATLLLDGAAVADKLTAYQISGEDLQGEYWGAVLMVPFSWFSEALDLPADSPVALEGNILREHPAQSSAAPEGETLRFLLS